jgi:MFS family permease
MPDAGGGAPPLLAMGMMPVASHFADRSGRRKAFVWPFLVIGAVAFSGSYLLGVSSFWPAFVLLGIADGAMYAPYGPFLTRISDRLPRTSPAGRSP